MQYRIFENFVNRENLEKTFSPKSHQAGNILDSLLLPLRFFSVRLNLNWLTDRNNDPQVFPPFESDDSATAVEILSVTLRKPGIEGRLSFSVHVCYYYKKLQK